MQHWIWRKLWKAPFACSTWATTWVAADPAIPRSCWTPPNVWRSVVSCASSSTRLPCECAWTPVKAAWSRLRSGPIPTSGTADLSAYKVTTSREVYNFASQSNKTHELNQDQVLTLSKLVKSLPPSAKTPEINNLILVSVVEKGQAQTYLYNRLNPPRDIVRLYELTRASLDRNPVP
jgi:hypothetical protein